jgi:beta-galactosidase
MGNRITLALAEILGNHPGLISWQLDNEIKCHIRECFCDNCAAQFRAWLEEKYGDIETLNSLWGTDIWSERYDSFQQVALPQKNTPFPGAHSSLQNAYSEFTMKSAAAFAAEQAAIIREHSQAPVTTNMKNDFYIDKEHLIRHLDFVTFDEYHPAERAWVKLRNYDFYRTMKPGVPFWVMETSPGHNGSNVGWLHHTHPDGYLQCEGIAALASGARGYAYWLWRQQRTGAESPHGSIIYSWGAKSLGYDNVVDLKRKIDTLTPFLSEGKPLQADVAVVYSERARRMAMAEKLYGDMGNYQRILDTLAYLPLLRSGIHRDIVLESASVEGYTLVVSPMMIAMNDEYIDRMEQFVRNGGIWIVGPLSGYRTDELTVHTDSGLGTRLERLAGVRLDNVVPLEAGGTDTLFSSDPQAFHRLRNSTAAICGQTGKIGGVTFTFNLDNAESIGRIESGIQEGACCAAVRQFGSGAVITMGAVIKETALCEHFYRWAADRSGVRTRYECSVGTTVIPRSNGVVVINMQPSRGSVRLPFDGKDIFSGRQLSATVSLEPWEIVAVRQKKR